MKAVSLTAFIIVIQISVQSSTQTSEPRNEAINQKQLKDIDDKYICVVNVHYISQNGQETYMTMQEYPSELGTKMKVFNCFRRYMAENLMKAGASAAPAVRETDGLTRLSHLDQWFRTSQGVIMYLTNGTLQINFKDHTKIVLCPLMAAVTFMDQDGNFRTFPFSTIEEHGCDKILYSNLNYALKKSTECSRSDTLDNSLKEPYSLYYVK